MILTASCMVFPVYAEDYEYGEIIGALGDVNYDGNINASDASYVLVYSASNIAGTADNFSESWGGNISIGDVDKNGIVDAFDASFILNYSALMGAGMGVQRFEDVTVSVTESEDVFNIVYGDPVLSDSGCYVPIMAENPALEISALEFTVGAQDGSHYTILTDSYELYEYYNINIPLSMRMTTAENNGLTGLSWARSSKYTPNKALAILAFSSYQENITLPEITVISAGYTQDADKAVKYAVSSPQTQETLKQGDVTGDGEIDILDVITVNKAILGKEELSEAQLKAIDFNNNGKPEASESLMIMKYIVGIIASFTE